MPCNENPTRHDCEFNHPHPSQAEHPAPATTWAEVAESIALFAAVAFVIWVIFS